MLIRQGLSEENSFSFRLATLLFQQREKTRESFSRRFKCRSDLLIPSTAQIAGEKDVLPGEIGLSANGLGKRWSVSELLRRGREALGKVSASVDGEAVIHAGIVAAARINPIAIEALTYDEARRLIRLALFDLGPATTNTLDGAIGQRVMVRLSEAIQKHVDLSTEDFHTWFFGNRDNLIKQIAQRRTGGGPIEREAVRQILLEVGFRSYEYVAQAMQFAMDAMSQSYSPQLTTAERSLFEALYFARLELGGFSCFMLHSQFHNLREIILETMNSPKGTTIQGILMRALQFLSEMNSKRREADRRYKSAAKSRNARGQLARTSSLRDGDGARTHSTVNSLGVLAEYMRRQRGAQCCCDSTDSWIVKVDPVADSNTVVLNESCEVCGHCETTQMERSEIQRLSKEMQQREF